MDGFDALFANMAAFLPDLLVAILILVVGWLVALGVSKLVESLLHRTSLDDRLAGMMRGGSPDRLPIERWIALAVFWLIMLFVLLIFFQRLNLTAISGPVDALLTSVVVFLPRILAAAALALLAFLLATVLRLIITRVLNASGISQRLSDSASVDPRSRVTIGQTIGTVVFWLVILLFLPAILDTLELQGILAPVQGMVDSILGALPNILGAIVVLGVGYLVARIIRQIVSSLLAGTGIDRLTERAGVQGTMREQRLSDVIAMIVFVLIMIPVVIAALNVLDIPAVSQPAANMLNDLLLALPALFGAFLILVVAYFVARLVGQLVSSLLAGVGFNNIFSGLSLPMGMTSEPERPTTTTSPDVTTPGATASPAAALRRTRPSDIVGWVVMVSIILFAVLQAAQMLGFEALTVLIGQFIVAAWNILFGLIIFGIGLWLSTMAYRMIRDTGMANADILATAARVAIIVFATALALRQMGIAESIVNLAFGLMLGAVAVAAAIAFGVGGRDVARDLLERWRGQIRSQASQPTTPRTSGPSTSGPTIPQTGGTTTRGQNVSGSQATQPFTDDEERGESRRYTGWQPGDATPGDIDDRGPGFSDTEPGRIPPTDPDETSTGFDDDDDVPGDEPLLPPTRL